MLKKLNFIYCFISIYYTNLHSIFIVMQTYTFFLHHITIVSFFLLFLQLYFRSIILNENNTEIHKTTS